MILALDVGTSSVKGALISHNGKLISEARVFYKSSESAVLVQALKELVSKLDSTFFIDGIAVSGNGPTFIPLFADGSSGNPILWFSKNENPLFSGKSLYLPKLLWLKENDAELYDKADVFLPSDSFVNFLLTGEKSAAVVNDRFIPFFWSGEDAENNSLDADKLPPLIFTGEKIGKVSKTGEKIFGIKSGIPVFAAGSDFLMAILGTATLEPGQACDRTGTSEGINICIASEAARDCSGYRTMPHITENCSNISALIPDSGKIFAGYKDCRNIRDIEESDAFAEVCRLLRKLEHEGFASDALRISGGQAKNPVWNQAKANALEKRILVPEIVDAELCGCACAAFAGLGEFISPSQAAEQLVKIQKEYIPQ